MAETSLNATSNGKLADQPKNFMSFNVDDFDERSRLLYESICKEPGVTTTSSCFAANVAGAGGIQHDVSCWSSQNQKAHADMVKFEKELMEVDMKGIRMAGHIANENSAAARWQELHDTTYDKALLNFLLQGEKPQTNWLPFVNVTLAAEDDLSNESQFMYNAGRAIVTNRRVIFMVVKIDEKTLLEDMGLDWRAEKRIQEEIHFKHVSLKELEFNSYRSDVGLSAKQLSGKATGQIVRGRGCISDFVTSCMACSKPMKFACLTCCCCLVPEKKLVVDQNSFGPNIPRHLVVSNESVFSFLTGTTGSQTSTLTITRAGCLGCCDSLMSGIKAFLPSCCFKCCPAAINAITRREDRSPQGAIGQNRQIIMTHTRASVPPFFKRARLTITCSELEMGTYKTKGQDPVFDFINALETFQGATDNYGPSFVVTQPPAVQDLTGTVARRSTHSADARIGFVNSSSSFRGSGSH